MYHKNPAKIVIQNLKTYASNLIRFKDVMVYLFIFQKETASQKCWFISEQVNVFSLEKSLYFFLFLLSYQKVNMKI